MLFETSYLLAEVIFLCKFFKLEIQVRHLHSPPAVPHKFENMNIIHLYSSLRWVEENTGNKQENISTLKTFEFALGYFSVVNKMTVPERKQYYQLYFFCLRRKGQK